MTTTAPPTPPPDTSDALLASSMSRGRRVRNGIASAWMIGSVFVALVPLVLIFGYVAAKGASAFSWKFLTSPLPFVTRFAGGGIAPAIVGTLLLTAVAAAMAIPLGVLAAVYLNEYGKQRPTARLIRFLADVMTGVPSVVMGLFIATVWVRGGVHLGFSTFAGSLALGALMLPIVIRSSEEILRLVPDELRQGSDALGARRSNTVLRVVLPAALPGVVSGAMLAVARAAGETAPLLFTIGAARVINTDIFRGAQAALSRVIFDNSNVPFPAAQERAWGAALALILIVFICTVIARVVSSKFSRLTR